MGISTYLANKLLDHQVGKASYTMPTVYVGLSSTTPTAGGSNITEPSTGSYARVTTAAGDWSSASAGATTTLNTLTFPTATADWVSGADLTHGVLFDAPTGGNMLSFGALTTAKNCLNGDTLAIPVGDLDITLS